MTQNSLLLYICTNGVRSKWKELFPFHERKWEKLPRLCFLWDATSGLLAFVIAKPCTEVEGCFQLMKSWGPLNKIAWLFCWYLLSRTIQTIENSLIIFRCLTFNQQPTNFVSNSKHKIRLNPVEIWLAFESLSIQSILMSIDTAK